MKDKFIELYKRHIKREGADKLLEWLEKTDFFEAPASTMFHGSHEGGLVEHSLNVFNQLVEQVSNEKAPVKLNPTAETIAIIGLLHDVCKANTYEVYQRNVKDEKGQWKKVDAYRFNEKFTFGHGEKSVFLIERFMKLTVQEAVCIRYHMGAYEGEHAWRSLGNVYKNFPLALLTHFADMRANHFLESK